MLTLRPAGFLSERFAGTPDQPQERGPFIPFLMLGVQRSFVPPETLLRGRCGVTAAGFTRSLNSRAKPLWRALHSVSRQQAQLLSTFGGQPTGLTVASLAFAGAKADLDPPPRTDLADTLEA